MREWIARIIDWCRRGRLDAELGEELRFHQAQLERDARMAGIAEPEAAWAARRRLGNLTRIREAARERWSLPWLEHRVQDVRYAVRGLRRSPGFTFCVVMTFALGIGANAAIFSVVDRLLFRPPPLLVNPARAHRLYYVLPNLEGPGELVVPIMPYAYYVELSKWTTSFERTAMASDHTLAIGVRDDAREMPVGVVSASFFSFFDAPPALGRYFTAQEDAPPTGIPVAVLSYGMWQARYGGRTDVLGTTLQIGPTLYTVIGVAPRAFVGLWPDQPPVAFIPISAFEAGRTAGQRGEGWWTNHGSGFATMLVQRKSGVSLAAANADLTNAMIRSWEVQVQGPDALRPPPGMRRPHVVVASILPERGPLQTSLAKVAALVGGMALIVLFIACANVANLLLARALRRRREIAVRLSLGVSGWRLLAQLLTESMLLSLLGGIAGVLVAQWCGSALRALFLPDGATAPVMRDTRTLVFVGIAVLVAGVLTALAPVWQAGRVELTRDLKTGAREGTIHKSRARVTLLVVQGALSVVLLVGAGLFVRSLGNVRHLWLGYDVSSVLKVDLNMRGVRLDDAHAVALRERLLSTAQHIPGAEHAALHLTLPFGARWIPLLDVPGRDPSVDLPLEELYVNAVTPDYFATMGTRIVRGRGIGPQDVAGAPGAVVVSQAMAKLFWPGRDAIGQCLKVGGRKAPCTYVVGIAEDVKNTSLSDDPGYYYYLSAAQYGLGQTRLLVRMRGDASHEADAIRRVLQKEMPGASYLTVTPFAEIVGKQMRSWLLGATMFVVFGLLALVLASVGLYGVIAYNVTQRSHEMGVRIALGARTPDVVWLVVRQGALLGGLGIVIGALIALGAAGWVRPLLFDESPRDPVIYAAVATAMFVVAVAASFIPAWRAARVDPNVALRAE